MYAIGQTVLYGANGVCRISEITTRKIGKEAIEYYVLKPMGMQASTVYVPTKNEELVGRMRAVGTAEEVRALLAADSSLSWVDNNAERFEFFHAVLSRGECGELMAMMRLMRASAQAARDGQTPAPDGRASAQRGGKNGRRRGCRGARRHCSGGAASDSRRNDGITESNDGAVHTDSSFFRQFLTFFPEGVYKLITKP